MTRDEKTSQIIHKLSFHAAQCCEETYRWREEAQSSDAVAHARLYQRVGDHLATAVEHLDAAATLMDPRETDVEESDW